MYFSTVDPYLGVVFEQVPITYVICFTELEPILLLRKDTGWGAVVCDSIGYGHKIGDEFRIPLPL